MFKKSPLLLCFFLIFSTPQEARAQITPDTYAITGLTGQSTERLINSQNANDPSGKQQNDILVIQQGDYSGDAEDVKNQVGSGEKSHDINIESDKNDSSSNTTEHHKNETGGSNKESEKNNQDNGSSNKEHDKNDREQNNKDSQDESDKNNNSDSEQDKNNSDEAKKNESQPRPDEDANNTKDKKQSVQDRLNKAKNKKAKKSDSGKETTRTPGPKTMFDHTAGDESGTIDPNQKPAPKNGGGTAKTGKLKASDFDGGNLTGKNIKGLNTGK